MSDLRKGDVVWTIDASGNRVAAPLVEASHAAVPKTHVMDHVQFADGRELLVSPGHPTCSVARASVPSPALADLVPGKSYDGSAIVEATRVPYGEDATFDILPAGDTGCYWANGVLLGSTLK